MWYGNVRYIYSENGLDFVSFIRFTKAMSFSWTRKQGGIEDVEDGCSSQDFCVVPILTSFKSMVNECQ